MCKAHFADVTMAHVKKYYYALRNKNFVGN